MYPGESIQIKALGEGLVEVCFDRQGEAINKLCDRTMREFGEVTALLREQAAASVVRGVLVTSAKDVFIVGADITGFPAKFRKTAEQITADAWVSNQFAFGFDTFFGNSLDFFHNFFKFIFVVKKGRPESPIF